MIRLIPRLLPGLLLIGVLALPATAGAAGPRELDVRAQDANGNDQVIARFHEMTCKRAKKKTAFLQFYGRAVSEDKKWILRVSISDDAWKGFGTYRLPYGMEADPYFSLDGPGPYWTSLYGSPLGLPFGGSLKFSPKGGRMSMGFVAVGNKTLSEGGAVGGAVECNFPKKPKKKPKS